VADEKTPVAQDLSSDAGSPRESVQAVQLAPDMALVVNEIKASGAPPDDTQVIKHEKRD
jgi:hypothetical protein